MRERTLTLGWQGRHVVGLHMLTGTGPSAQTPHARRKKSSRIGSTCNNFRALTLRQKSGLGSRSKSQVLGLGPSFKP